MPIKIIKENFFCRRNYKYVTIKDRVLEWVLKMDFKNNWQVFPGFELELVAEGLDLPTNLAPVPDPGKDPRSPLFYFTELYGQVKVLTNDWSVYTYATQLLNYEPDHKIPGSGESGLTGICVEPKTGDLFLSMLYFEEGKPKNKLVRTSSKNGWEMDSMTVILEGIPSVHAAHQIQAVTLGFDGKLYVNIGDGMLEPDVAQDENDLRGKILRMNLDGTVPEDNPIPGSLIYAKGFRNPFGAVWRKSDRSLYITDNGPAFDDRIARVEAGKNYGWPQSMRQNSLFWWEYTQAPAALAFMQDGEFPPPYHNELFVALFGGAYRQGPNIKGKKIVKIRLADDDTTVKSYDEFVTYVGAGPASPCGLAFGPGGLYFTDLHGEGNGLSKHPSGHIFRVKPIE